MEIDLTYDDIDIIHRLNKGRKSPRPIFNCPLQQLLQQRANVSRALEASQEEWFKSFGSRPQKSLHQQEPNCLQSWPIQESPRSWTESSDGNIFVKPDPINDVIVKIQSEEDFNKL